MTLPLVTNSRVSLAAALIWARERGAAPLFSDQILPALHVAVENQRAVNGGYAVDFAIVAAQSAKETGWGKFGGVIDASWRNTAGIKIAEGGGNFVPDAHERFDTWGEGARAHLNHLAAYTGLATVGEPHGRYHVVLGLSWAGTIETLDQLSARWAPSGTYADSIEQNARIIHELDESSAAMTDVLVAVGHGRRPTGTFDPGACVPGTGRCEQQEGDPVVAAVTNTLRGLGLTVREVRLGGPNFVGAANLANRLGVRAAVEIHHDWIGAPRGAGGFWYPGSGPGKLLSDAILERVLRANLAIKRNDLHRGRNLGWTRMTNMPAVLWELDRIGTVSRKVDYGVAVATGIADFLGVRVTPDAPEDNSGGSDIPVYSSRGIGIVRGDRWLMKDTFRGGPADRAFHFGRPDDIPLGGGDAIAVRRGNRWLVRGGEGGGEADHDFHFGRASDFPLLTPATQHSNSYPIVVRGDRWMGKRSYFGGAADFDFRFGRPGDIPIAGAWNGVSVGAGVFRDGVFYLRGSLSGGRAYWSFHFGRKGDVPIVWRYRGKDRVGVRRGRTWYLRETLSGGPADRVFVFGR